MTAATLAAEGLVKRYGSRDVVRGVDVDLAQGEVVGLLGPNGAGKTTTFSMLAGIVKPTAGRVLLDGKDITRLPLHQRARMGVGYLPQEASVFKKLTVRQNLEVILEYSTLTKTEQRQRIDELLATFGLTKLCGNKAAGLSGGERRRLEIARTLLLSPRFVLMDEPFAGIDPLAVLEIQSLIASLQDMNIGVLISDHNVRETLGVCTRAALVYDGAILLTGDPHELASNPLAQQLYLGEGFCLLPRNPS